MSYLGSTKLFKQILDSNIEQIKDSIVSSVSNDDHRVLLKKKLHGGDEVSKKELHSILVRHCRKTGLKSYLEQMTQVTLTLLHEDFINKEDEDKKKNKIFLIKRITNGIDEDFENYFIELKDEKLKAFTQLTASQLAPKIIEEMTLVGIEIFLFNLPVATLKALCVKLGYEVPVNNPNVMVTSILCGEVPAKKEAPAKKVITFSKKKLPLKKGLTFQDVFQHYYVEELQQFCRDKQLKISGTKKEVIIRILNFLNHGIVEVPKQKSKKADDAAKKADEESEDDAEDEKENVEAEQEEEEEDDDAEYKEEDIEERPEEVVEKVATPIKRQTSKIVNPSPLKSKSKKSSK